MKIFHPIRILVLFAAAAVAVAPARADRLRGVELGEPIPQFSLTTMDNVSIRSDALQGKVVVMVFLAAEQKNSEQAASSAHRVFQKLGQDDLLPLYVAADSDRAPYFASLKESLGLSEPIAYDFDRSLYGKLGLIVLPTTIIVDREGNLAQVISGHRSNYTHLLEAHTAHTLGLINDEQLKAQLRTESYQVDSDADRAARHRSAAAILANKGLLQDAESELEIAVALNPEDVATRLDLAEVHLRQKHFEEANTIVQAILDDQPGHRQAKLIHGILLIHQGDLDHAEQVFLEALKLNPDPARAHYFLGMVYEKKGMKDDAISHYRKALVQLLGEPVD